MMKTDAKIIATINDMRAAELGAVILGAGYALPTAPHENTLIRLRNMVMRLYDNGTISANDILAEYQGGL